MKRHRLKNIIQFAVKLNAITACAWLLLSSPATAEQTFIPKSWQAADPSARVFKNPRFKDTLFVYTSTDNPYLCEKLGWDENKISASSGFCMTSYQVHWTKNDLAKRVKAGKSPKWTSRYIFNRKTPVVREDLKRKMIPLEDDILNYKNVRTGELVPKSQRKLLASLWAPDVVEVQLGPKKYKYYMHFPAKFSMWVAESDTPKGPFKNPKRVLEVVYGSGDGASGKKKVVKNTFWLNGTDPSVIKFGGKYYIYFQKDEKIWVAEFDGQDMTRVKNDTKKLVQGVWGNTIGHAAFFEGPFAFVRNSEIHLMFATTRSGPYSLGVAKSSHHRRKFEEIGNAVPVIPDKHPYLRGTNHGSIVKFKGKSYVFYHYHLNTTAANKFRVPVFDRICFKSNGKLIPSRHTWIRNSSDLSDMTIHNGCPAGSS